MIFQGIAGGNILPSRFVMSSTTEDNTFLEATAGAKPVGISQKGTRNTPYSSLDDGYAAADGENLNVFGPSEICGLDIGGTVAAGDTIVATTNGKGITTTTDGHWYGAVALQAGVSGDRIEVQIQIGMRGA